mmetsp:Transcript_124757/g.353161  ORF Transcript_124757/g.353161 Transcript_124757/m.353161 type:complete len:391 (+) Transcript_124757:189-1361(+)
MRRQGRRHVLLGILSEQLRGLAGEVRVQGLRGRRPARDDGSGEAHLLRRVRPPARAQHGPATLRLRRLDLGRRPGRPRDLLRLPRQGGGRDLHRALRDRILRRRRRRDDLQRHRQLRLPAAWGRAPGLHPGALRVPAARRPGCHLRLQRDGDGGDLHRGVRRRLRVRRRRGAGDLHVQRGGQLRGHEPDMRPEALRAPGGALGVRGRRLRREDRWRELRRVVPGRPLRGARHVHVQRDERDVLAGRGRGELHAREVRVRYPAVGGLEHHRNRGPGHGRDRRGDVRRRLRGRGNDLDMRGVGHSRRHQPHVRAAGVRRQHHRGRRLCQAHLQEQEVRGRVQHDVQRRLRAGARSDEPGVEVHRRRGDRRPQRHGAELHGQAVRHERIQRLR